MTPYTAQVEKLNENIKDGNAEVGTVECYQGRENYVILSVVRSNTRGIGFLNNWKRLNAALTRAKELLIVIGNPHTLSLDSSWRSFIKLCQDYDRVNFI